MTRFTNKRLVIAILIGGALFVVAISWLIFPSFKKFLLTTYLAFPSLQTIYGKNEHPEYPKTTIELPVAAGYLIVVYKDKHELHLFKDGTFVKKYNVNIRREMADAKVAEDDQSPEGVFMIETMDIVTDPPWERWMRLDTLEKAKGMYISAYPDGQERITSFENEYGPIKNDADIRVFNEKNPRRELLRGVGIHGGGFSINRDWTKGCVGMADKDVIELFDFLKDSPNGGIGTKVVIQD